MAWIRLFYTDISSCVQNNGWTSDFFSLSRGVRQGCPLSPYLFTLCAEVLLLLFTRIVADAGPTGIRAVLTQLQDGLWRVISYASRNLTDVERRYSQTEKEGLALV